MNVEQFLKYTDEEQIAVVMLTAYGVSYANSIHDGMKTVKDIKENMNYTCLHAKVESVKSDIIIIDREANHALIITAEICKSF